LTTAFLVGTVTDQAAEAHSVRINWGDGTIDTLNLGAGRSSPFLGFHRYRGHQPRFRLILVTALDDEGVASAPLFLFIRLRK